MLIRSEFLALVLLVPMLVPALAAAQGGPAPTVAVTRDGDRWTLTRGGSPYFVRGAGGGGSPTLLASLGGNSIRTWGADQLEPRDWPDGTHRSLMDVAADLGLTVCVGFWVEHPRHGFDYTDESAVRAQLDAARDLAERWKDHPALLMWGVGNEVAIGADADLAMREVNRVARVFKEADPNHPTMTAIAGVWGGIVPAFTRNCHDVDILGVNAYGGLNAVPMELLRQGYAGPYIVTEFGPVGHWETASVPWGAPIEQSSAGKARTYQEAYTIGVLGQPDRCLGAYAFLWGHKQERTATWYSMLLASGERTPAADTMSYLWTGAWPEHRAPLVERIESPAALRDVRAGQAFDASVVIDRAPHDLAGLDVEWVLLEESTATTTGGDPEQAPSRVDDRIEPLGLGRARVRAPDAPGPYRLFVYVRDAHGGAGTANMPFRVIAP